jgi:hypothetical protein
LRQGCGSAVVGTVAVTQRSRAEREAHLEGQARIYGGGNHSSGGGSSPDANGADPGDDEFVPGTRHMPVR